jgi:two-component system sensor histidine kinase TctE
MSVTPSTPATSRAPATLRRQLLLLLLLPLAMVWVFSAIAVYWFADSFAQLAYDRALFDTTLDISGQVRVNDGAVQVDLPRAALNMIENDEFDRVYYAVSGPRGEFVAGHRGLPLPPEDAAIGVSMGKPILYDADFSGAHVRVAALYAIPQGATDKTPVLVQVAETLNKRHTLSREILAGTLALELLLIGLAALVVWRGVKGGLRPLDALSAEIRNRSHRDLSPLPEAHAPGEVRPLIHAMNDLLGRLSGALSAQSRFIADAAHQLRTPLAGIRTQTELALRELEQTEPGSTGPDHVRRTLTQLNGATERTTHLVNQLLSLARAEPDALHSRRMARLDLATLAREIAAAWVPRAVTRDIDLGFEAVEAGAVPVDGDALMLGELLTNLLDNAVRYTPRGGRVTVRLATEDGAAVLSVEDDGPGIPEAERERVFERFHRVLGSGADGAGLGLAIVREIAEAHGARVSLSPGAHGTGTRIRVAFPAAAG